MFYDQIVVDECDPLNDCRKYTTAIAVAITGAVAAAVEYDDKFFIDC